MCIQKYDDSYSVRNLRNAMPSRPLESCRLGNSLILFDVKSQPVCGELVGRSIGHRGSFPSLTSAMLR